MTPAVACAGVSELSASRVRRLRSFARHVLHKIFLSGQRLGLDILPRHYYSGVPNIAELENTDVWRSPRSMAGVSGTSLEQQLAFIDGCCSPRTRALIAKRDVYGDAVEKVSHGGFGPVEADFLYCFVASFQPRRIIQVGAGLSTAVILSASSQAGYSPEVVCIDPFPGSFLKTAASNGQIELINQKAQDVSLSTLSRLEDGDLLFVDSTHTVRAGGEVNYIVLEVLPRLSSGVFVHFHDVYFPYDYQPTLLKTLFFWSESVLLHAFLVNNPRFSITASLSMLHHGCPGELQKRIPRYRPAPMQDGLYTSAETEHFPSSTYLQVQKSGLDANAGGYESSR